ncbi:MAG: hypothetical protein C4617_04415 [Candidatus Liberibacter europaeus]|uniref:Uncharacterized protein n=1 Tax=Candidatus Liberibacter europaeus TaxID=744859 RepID=A0A2T4VWU3_9HYPH|nr:MAG: hypothetical protein C4617_04415 [Candidatus Liberibacter europaeus]
MKRLLLKYISGKDTNTFWFYDYAVISLDNSLGESVKVHLTFPDGKTVQGLNRLHLIDALEDDEDKIVDSQKYIYDLNILWMIPGGSITFRDLLPEGTEVYISVSTLVPPNTRQGNEASSSSIAKAPYHLVREADLHPVKSRLEEVETAVKKVDKIDDIATELEEVRKKAEHVELLKKQTDQIAKDASDTAKRIEAVHQKAKQVDSLAQATNTIEQKVDNLSGKTEEVCKKIEQIDLSKIEGLDPQTQKYLQTIQKQLNASRLTLQEEDSCGRPTIHMKNKAGQLVAQIWYNTYDNLVMGRVNDKGGFASYLVFRPNGGIDINSETFVDGSSPSIFDEMAKRLTPHFLGLLRDRTMARCAILEGIGPSKNEIISGSRISVWCYPSENSSGYLTYSSTSDYNPSDEDKRKNWKVVGSTNSHYTRWYWLQEVIEPTDIVFKTVGSSTLADNLIDLKTMQNKINTIDALQTKISQLETELTADKTKISQLETELTADKTKISQLENADKSNRTFASKLLAIVKDLPQDLKAMEQRIKELEARSA